MKARIRDFANIMEPFSVQMAIVFLPAIPGSNGC
jgi:hypothetical protein